MPEQYIQRVIVNLQISCKLEVFDNPFESSFSKRANTFIAIVLLVVYNLLIKKPNTVAVDLAIIFNACM